MRIQVLYFGVLKDLVGQEQEYLNLAEGSRVEDAIRLLRGRASNWEERIWETMAIAVNLEYASFSTILHDADAVALLPPVSGGLD